MPVQRPSGKCRLKDFNELKKQHSDSRVTRIVKEHLAARLRNEANMRRVWSRGSFVRSMGSVTSGIVHSYVQRQYSHRHAAPAEQPR